MNSEWKFTEELARLSRSADCIGYDACPGPKGLVYNIDGYHEDWSKYPFLTYRDWAYRAVAASVSDLIASGARPLAIFYSIGAGDPQVALDIAAGVGEASRDLNVSVLKSDYNKGRGAWIDVASIGEAQRIVSRTNAEPGNLVAQIGYLGYGLIEKLVFEGRIPLEEALKVGKIPRRVPPPAWMIVSKYATASSDNSDGWGATLYNIAFYSSVGIEIYDVKVDPLVEEIVEEYGLTVEWWRSWEDYNIALTLREEDVEEFNKDCRRAGLDCWIVGRVVEGPSRVRIQGRDAASGWSWINV